MKIPENNSGIPKERQTIPKFRNCNIGSELQALFLTTLAYNSID